jgi:hypothetical protein
MFIGMRMRYTIVIETALLSSLIGPLECQEKTNKCFNVRYIEGVNILGVDLSDPYAQG